MSKFNTLLLSVLLSLLSFTNVALAEEVLEFESYQEFLTFFEKLGYTEKAWDTGFNSIMSYNKLAEIDEARLVGPVIILTPVGVGSD
jgi:hypothetical protein